MPPIFTDDKAKQAGTYVPLPSSEEELIEAQRALRRGRSRRRAFHFGVISLIVVAFFTHIHLGPERFRSGVLKIYKGCGGGHGRPSPHFPIPHDLELHDCVEEWDEVPGDDLRWTPLPAPPSSTDSPAGRPPPPPPPPHRLTTTVSFEAWRKMLFFARGSLSHGSFEVTHGLADDDDEEVKVDVSIGFWRGDAERLTNHVKVCQITREDGSAGLGIFTPKWKPHHRGHPHAPPHRGPHFDVRVRLPRHEGVLLYLPSFESDLPMFRQHVDGRNLIYGNLTLKTVNEPIFAKEVEAEHVKLVTTNAPISGDFKTNSSILLETVNAPIKATVELVSEDPDCATRARVQTVNAGIDVAATLTSKVPDIDIDGHGGRFALHAATVRGKVNVRIPDAPVDSVLDLTAETVLADVDVYMHPTFQGDLRLDTVLGPAKLDDASGAEDPAGEGRTRVVKLDRVSSGSLKGATWWGDGEPLGSARLKTTLAPVTLHI